MIKVIEIISPRFKNEKPMGFIRMHFFFLPPFGSRELREFEADIYNQ